MHVAELLVVNDGFALSLTRECFRAASPEFFPNLPPLQPLRALERYTLLPLAFPIGLAFSTNFDEILFSSAWSGYAVTVNITRAWEVNIVSDLDASISIVAALGTLLLRLTLYHQPQILSSLSHFGHESQ